MAIENIPSNSLRSFFKELNLYFTGTLVFIFLPLILILFIPTFIFRPIANCLRKMFRPDLADILSTTSSMYAQADTEDSAKTIIVCQISYQGIVTHEHFLRAFQERLLDCKGTDGNWRYPEFRQYITNWMGYKFWKWETKFDIREHITAIQSGNSNLSPEDLNGIGSKLMTASFQKGRSPWEIVLFPGVLENCEERTVMFLRLNHALCDGSSLQFILQRFCGFEMTKRVLTPRLPTANLRHWLLLPFKTLRVFGEMASSCHPSNLWRISEEEKSSQMFQHTGGNIPVDTIKKIKNKHGVSFTSVVYSLVAGGVRNFIVEKGLDNNIPRSLPSIALLPYGSSHPDQLINKFAQVQFPFPVGESRPLTRLKFIHNNFENARDSPLSIIGHWYCKLVGCHFNPVGRFLTKSIDVRLVTSYFPMGDDLVLDGHRLSSLSFYVGVRMGQTGAFFYITTFSGNLSVTSVFNAAAMPYKDIERLSTLIEEEAQELLNGNDANSLTKWKLQ